MTCGWVGHDGGALHRGKTAIGYYLGYASVGSAYGAGSMVVFLVMGLLTRP